MSSTPKFREWAGVLLALSATVGFALSNSFAGLAYQGGSNPMTLSAFRFVLPSLALAIWLGSTGVSLRLPTREGRITMLLGVATAVYTWAVLSAISIIPLALAILIFYLFPLIAAVILGSFGWERLGWSTVAAIVLAFCGLALALMPRGADLELAGVFLALLGAVGLGTVIAISSRVFLSGDSRPVTLHMATVGGVILMAVCASQGAFAFPQTGLGWVGFVGAAACYAYAMIAFYIAVSMIGPTQVALLSYAEPVLAAGLAVALLGQPVEPVEMAGMALVIAALVGSTLLRQQQRRQGAGAPSRSNL